MSKRKPGWYWVKIGQDGDWECAEWNGVTWGVAGTDYDWPESRVEVVGPRIPTPDESQLDVDALAQHIRRVDGNNSMGTGALAESICEWLAAPKSEDV